MLALLRGARECLRRAVAKGFRVVRVRDRLEFRRGPLLSGSVRRVPEKTCRTSRDEWPSGSRPRPVCRLASSAKKNLRRPKLQPAQHIAELLRIDTGCNRKRPLVRGAAVFAHYRLVERQITGRGQYLGGRGFVAFQRFGLGHELRDEAIEEMCSSTSVRRDARSRAVSSRASVSRARSTAMALLFLGRSAVPIKRLHSLPCAARRRLHRARRPGVSGLR